MTPGLAAVVGVAFAHHTTATTAVSPPPAPTADPDEVEGVHLVAGTRLDALRLGRRVHGATASAAEAPATIHRLTALGGLSLPGQRRVQLAMPVGRVHTDAGDRWGAGDASLQVAQGLGQRWRLGLSAGITAPTGRTDTQAQLSALDMRGAADGSLTLSGYDTRANLGVGSWSAQAGATAQAPLGPAAIRATVALSQPLTRTEEGYRWGRDTSAGAALLSPPLGPVRVEAGAQRRWHQADRFTQVDLDTGEHSAAGARRDAALTAGLAVRVSQQVQCRASMHHVVAGWAEGIQLMTTAGAGAGCEVRAPWPSARRTDAVEASGDAQAEGAPSALPSRSSSSPTAESKGSAPASSG